MGNLWQAGNTMWTSISQSRVLITRLYFPDTHLLSYFFLYQSETFFTHVYVFFPHNDFTRVDLWYMPFLYTTH